MTALRLDRLELSNFRCFKSCTLELHPKLTVLVADNGNGKTALLDAAALALAAYVAAVKPTEQLRRMSPSDVRKVLNSQAMTASLPVQYKADGVIGEASIQWGSRLAGTGKKHRPSKAKLSDATAASRQLLSVGSLLPLVAYYGTGRLWSEQKASAGRRTSLSDVSERIQGYSDCLSSSSSFKGVNAWHRDRVGETARPAFSESLKTNLALLAAVREATATVLKPTGWGNLHWDSALDCLVADHPTQGTLPVASLSDGVRNMLALVADVARRCASLNPELGENAAHKTPGVLLIDEVDMHLHPRWQQLVIELLTQAFPALQIIASTHSPHVLSTVDNQSIRVFRLIDGEAAIEIPAMQTRGVESADVLARVMGVDPMPQLKEAQDLSLYKSMIEDGKAESSNALSLRASLIEHFGASHPVMLDCERLTRFQKLRLKRDANGGQ